MYPGGPHQPNQHQPYPPTAALQQHQPPSSDGGSGSPIPWLVATIAGLFAIIFLALWLIGGGKDSSTKAAPSTITSTTTETSTTTATTTTTATRTETATAPQPTRQAPQPTPEPQAQWPSPPGGLASGYEWVRMGPYGTRFGCDQPQNSWPSRSSTCWQGPDGSWYFYGARQAG